ncbi:MAG: heavy metal translocating P-type ATPase [Hyphomonadaceae bacterium]|nr:heavy metal translocating P-type ATPase [Hyphomonadaceae bacterium]
MSDVLTDLADAGCPQGLAPAEAAPKLGLADPAPFVTRHKGLSRLELSVRGAKCGGCLSKIEKAVSALPGIAEARLNLSNGQMRVAWEGDLAPARITAAISDLGYGVAPLDPERDEDEARREERRLLTAMGVAGFAAANIMLLSISVWAGAGEMGESTRRIMHMISGAIAIPVVLFAGQTFFASAWRVLSKGRANMDVPISLAVLLALGVSIWETALGGEHAYFDACVMLLFFLLIGRFLDARLRRRAHAAATDLAALQARSVTRISASGQAESVRAREVLPGDMILLSPGERAVVDMDVVEGTTELDESLVSGESTPILSGPGARVYAGAVVLGNAIKGRAVAMAADSLMADIGRMLEAGEQRRSTYRKIAERAVSIYVPAVHTIALLTFIGWLLAGVGVREAIFIACSTLIITCPCALALAAPVTQVVASGRLFRAGVFLKSGDALERLAGTTHVVFDKTGTLTLGEPQLVKEGVAPETLAAAAQLARASRHPLSRALVAAEGAGPVARNVTEHAGLGLEGEVDGVTARLGSAEWVGADTVASDGPTLWFSLGEAAPIQLRFRDHIQEDAAEVLAGLKRRGMDFEIVSGDTASAVARTADALGISQWTAEVSPKGKVDRLEALRAEGKKVLMIGDGLNDAGALSLAHASMAPGGAMDVSQSASDAVYSGKGLGAILTTLDTSRRARSIMLQNFGLAALYNVIAVPIAVAGFASPLVAAIAMSASSLIVTLNALRQNMPAKA